MKRHLIIGALMALICHQQKVCGQTVDWFTGGNTSLNPSTSFLGTTDGVPINFRTNNTQRLRLNNTVSYTIGSFTAQAKNGALGLCPDGSMWTTGPGPFSNLHLADATADNMQIYGYRPWMRNGVTFTGNGDQGYIGQKYTSMDNTDVVIQWSDNPADSPWGVDRMRFIFTNGYNGSTTGARSLEGLEGMRLVPKNDSEMNVGIGDFNAFGGDPTERVHVRDGRVRIQQLPDNAETNQPYKVMVVDASSNPNERGVVKWKNISGFGDCTWQLQANNDVASAYSGSSCPWDYSNFVGVGVQFPKAKLQVEHDGSNPNFSGAVTMSTLMSTVVGGWGVTGHARTPLSTQFSSSSFYGVGGFGSNAKYTYGVTGLASNSAPGTTAIDVIGVSGSAIANANAQRVVGVYGKASGATGGNDWAAWFDGKGFLGGSAWTYSDGNLKQDVVDLPSAEILTGLMQLHPKSYSYNITDYAYLHLPTEPQLGLISQEVETIFPQLVQDVIRPAQVDSLGNIVEPELTFKAMNYQGLIPVLIAGFQHQQQMIDQQQATIAHLQDQINTCCAAQGGLAPHGGSMEQKMTPQENDLQEQRLLIIPNPVADLTTLEYYVPKAGKVTLQVSTSDGKPLATLREELAEAGAYTYSWNTTKLAAGTYFCTFMLDGALVVKRAVKVK